MEDQAERDLFRDNVRRFVETEFAPQIEEWEKAEAMPREAWTALGEAGLLCVDMPEEYGGAGADFRLSSVVVEELSRAQMGGLASCVSVHSDIVAHYIFHLGTAAQKQTWLPRMASGEAVGAVAMTEPAAGSDLQGMRSLAVPSDDGWTLNGSKTFITNGRLADVVVVAARSRPEGRALGTSLFLVDAALEGFRRGRNLEKIGQHAGDTTELFFDDLRLDQNAVLGTTHGGFGHLVDQLPRERVILSSGAVAAAQGAIALTVAYVRERKAFGQSLASFQNTRFRLAEMHTDMELARAFLEQCKAKLDGGTLDVSTAAMCKYASTEMQCRVVDGCLQLFGGYGYMREYPIARAFADARVQRIYGGTSEIMRELIARSLLGKG